MIQIPYNIISNTFVSRTLGHRHISTTQDIYGHVIAGSGRKASERFTEALKQARYAHLRKMAWARR